MDGPASSAPSTGTGVDDHPADHAPLTRAAQRTAHLAARDLRKAFDGRAVLDGVSVTISAGQRLAVVGDNGAGKSTLLRILAGQLEPDGGSVACTTGRTLVEQERTAVPGETVQTLRDQAMQRAEAALAALDAAAEAMGAGFAPAEVGGDGDAVTGAAVGTDATPLPSDAVAAYEQALATAERIEAWDALRRFDELAVAFGAGFAPETVLASLSAGQRYRLRLASALFDPAGAILLDEPSNHLDDDALDRLAEHLLAHPGITVLVTHDRWLLGAVATALFDLDPNADGGGALFTGRYDDYRSARARKLERWKEQRTAGLARIEALEERLDGAREKAARAPAPGKGASKHGRETRIVNPVAEFTRRLAHAKRSLVPAPPEPLRFRLDDHPAEPGTPLLQASGLSCPGRGAMRPGDAIDLRPGGRLLLRGPNGSGKSTILAMLAGQLPSAAGTVAHFDRDRVGLLAQEDHFDPAMLALSAIARAPGVPTEPDALIEAIRSTGLLRDADLSRRLGELSVGQRRRVALLRVLLARPAVLLLDEPTNHLSVLLVDELSDALATTQAAVVLVTHDRTLLETVADWPTISPA